MTFSYLASPYSHGADSALMEERFRLAELATANWMKRGKTVFSPIVHNHVLAGRFNLPKDYEFWRTHNEVMLTTAGELFLLEIPGWKECMTAQEGGIYAEFLLAQRLFLPIYTVNVDATQKFIYLGEERKPDVL